MFAMKECTLPGPSKLPSKPSPPPPKPIVLPTRAPGDKPVSPPKPS